MASIKATLVREALVLQDYTYGHFTHCKIPILTVLIIEACEVTRFLHDHLKTENLTSFFVLLTALEHKNDHNLAVLHPTIFF